MDDSFSIRQSGHIGQEILDADGRIIAWTTDDIVALVICKLLRENEGLLPDRWSSQRSGLSNWFGSSGAFSANIPQDQAE